ncbi:MAG TPA: cytochrome P460 family protein [Armatimonadota bacterium]|nr:cytochrome P460 family protein [Armatimonadota bacterium]
MRAGAPAFAGYRSWTRVNPRPVRFQSVAAQTACAPAAPARRPGRDPDPHAERFLSVYVNARGRDAMLTQSNPQFPVGSVIVKEKLPDARSRRPELLTVMVKRRPGYNAANGDWEYLVTDGAARVTARGKLENCASCHASERSTDFVFRNYLPDGAKLR